RRSATSPAASPDLPKRRRSRETDRRPSHPSSPEEPMEERVAEADPLPQYEYGRPRRSLPHGHVWTRSQPVPRQLTWTSHDLRDGNLGARRRPSLRPKNNLGTGDSAAATTRSPEDTAIDLWSPLPFAQEPMMKPDTEMLPPRDTPPRSPLLPRCETPPRQEQPDNGPPPGKSPLQGQPPPTDEPVNGPPPSSKPENGPPPRSSPLLGQPPPTDEPVKGPPPSDEPGNGPPPQSPIPPLGSQHPPPSLTPPWRRMPRDVRSPIEAVQEIRPPRSPIPPSGSQHPPPSLTPPWRRMPRDVRSPVEAVQDQNQRSRPVSDSRAEKTSSSVPSPYDSLTIWHPDDSRPPDL